MTPPPGSTPETQSVEPQDVAGPETSSYLLVIDDSSARRLPLPRDGVLVLGRGPDADLRIDTAAVSRRHAKLILAGGEAQIADLDSHNGTLVNGERVDGSRTLASGDVVAVGDITLVLRSEPQRGSGAAVDLGRLRARLEEELERAADYRRPLALAIVALGAAREPAALGRKALAALRRMDVLAWEGTGHLVVLLPELGGEAARAAALAVLAAVAPLAPEARGGVATYPGDGCDAVTLLAGARAAAAVAAAGEAAIAAETAVRHTVGDHSIVVADPAMIRLFDLIRRLAASALPVLVLGETGVGKENAAAAVHHWSARAAQPLVTLNCAAMPEALVESELFGHEKGAFSDARAAKPGLLERASGGTVFLDEVGELPLGVQAKLLRALEAKRITRLGDVREREVDLRIVAATNRDLEAEVAAGRFRRDLLFRLGAAVVELPPLRHRPREISILARAFLAAACARAGRPPLESLRGRPRGARRLPLPRQRARAEERHGVRRRHRGGRAHRALEPARSHRRAGALPGGKLTSPATGTPATGGAALPADRGGAAGDGAHAHERGAGGDGRSPDAGGRAHRDADPHLRVQAQAVRDVGAGGEAQAVTRGGNTSHRRSGGGAARFLCWPVVGHPG